MNGATPRFREMHILDGLFFLGFWIQTLAANPLGRHTVDGSENPARKPPFGWC